MFKRLAIVFLFLVFFIPKVCGEIVATITPIISTTPEPALTLQECYQLALKRSEIIAIKRETLIEAKGRFLQAFSGVLPKVYFEDQETYQDGPGQKTDHYPERKFTFSQPLFTGFKEFAAISASRAEQRQRKAEFLRAEQLLFIDVSDAFYLVLSYEKDLTILLKKQQALSDRVQELHKRQELGRSRESEVASSQATLSRLEAILSVQRSQLAVARQLLDFLVGQKTGNLREEDVWQQKDKISKEDFLAKVDQRPDLIAAQQAARVAQKQIAIDRAEFLPKVTADGDYFTKRVGVSSEVDWDVVLSVKVPLFQGGHDFGKVKESKSLAKQADLNTQDVRRRAQLEIENLYTQWQSALQQVQARQKAYEDSQKSYQLQLEDYRRSLVNNLDVLQALEDLVSDESELVAAQTQAHRLYSSLLTATGDVSL